MVVDVFVDIECCKDIKSVAKVNISWNGGITFEDREEVCGTDYGVNVYHRHNLVTVGVAVRLYNPHPIVRIRFVECFGELVNKCA